MECYIQIDKESKRVIAYSSNSSNTDTCLEIKINKEDIQFKELLDNPFIYVFNIETNTFIKDTKYQEDLIKQRENNIPDSQKIINLTKELAANKLENMKKDQTIKMLTSQQAAIMLDIMKLKGSN
ncbi:hypothetical protein [Clostridium sardiniense]|uniref:hypothetical protein n=1 Tax=Clostridium sardiniense TaxID=29369 RepID=UPI003D327522